MLDAEIHNSLAHTIKNWCNEQDFKRRQQQSISGHLSSINWLNKQLETKKLSQNNITEYKHQIRHHEINLAFLYTEI